jgi:predicted choloylglycine hydrolase
MKRLLHSSVPLRAFGLGLATVILAHSPVQACTIFTITDGDRVLFSNNEDWKDPQTKIWFVPSNRQFWSGRKTYGCAYVGFGNRWGQGGVNTEGLAFDWVAGYKTSWQRDPGMKSTKGNPAERMLESCATVEEAVAFFKSHWEPSFSYARILVADRTGASAVIGATDGHLDIKMMKESRGFGYCGHVVEKMLTEDAVPTLANAAKILQAARQQGQYATKYSNVFDLKSGDIFLYRFPDQPEAVQLNLANELKKGRHSYDLPKIAEQLKKEAK